MIRVLFGYKFADDLVYGVDYYYTEIAHGSLGNQQTVKIGLYVTKEVRNEYINEFREFSGTALDSGYGW